MIRAKGVDGRCHVGEIAIIYNTVLISSTIQTVDNHTVLLHYKVSDILGVTIPADSSWCDSFIYCRKLNKSVTVGR